MRSATERADNGELGLEIVAVNDITDPATLANLLRHDSTYGPWQVPVYPATTQRRRRARGVDLPHSRPRRRARCVGEPAGDGGLAGAGQSADQDLTAAGATVRTLVLPAREDIEIARQVRAIIR
jgi:hypothetical protein